MEQEINLKQIAPYLLLGTILAATGTACSGPASTSETEADLFTDKDKDGFSNALEKALGTNPDVFNSAYQDNNGVLHPVENRSPDEHPDLLLRTVFKQRTFHPDEYDSRNDEEKFKESFPKGYKILKEGDYTTNCFADVLGLEKGWIEGEDFEEVLSTQNSPLKEQGASLYTQYSEDMNTKIFTLLNTANPEKLEDLVKQAQDGDILVFHQLEGTYIDPNTPLSVQKSEITHACEVHHSSENGSIYFVSKLGEGNWIETYSVEELATAFDSPLVTLYSWSNN